MDSSCYRTFEKLQFAALHTVDVRRPLGVDVFISFHPPEALIFAFGLFSTDPEIQTASSNEFLFNLVGEFSWLRLAVYLLLFFFHDDTGSDSFLLDFFSCRPDHDYSSACLTWVHPGDSHYESFPNNFSGFIRSPLNHQARKNSIADMINITKY